jgi:hypothetical protein
MGNGGNAQSPYCSKESVQCSGCFEVAAAMQTLQIQLVHFGPLL